MKSREYYYSMITLVLFVIFSSYKYIPGVVVVGIIALIQRLISLYNVYVIQKHGIIDLVDSFVSHVVLFACILSY